MRDNIVYAQFGATKKANDVETMLERTVRATLDDHLPSRSDRAGFVASNTVKLIRELFASGSKYEIRIGANGELASLDPQVVERMRQQLSEDVHAIVKTILVAAESAIASAAACAVTAVVLNP